MTRMDRKSRALWQAAAARTRQWYAAPGFATLRSRSVVQDVKFAHSCLLKYARSGEPWDPFWWT